MGVEWVDLYSFVPGGSFISKFAVSGYLELSGGQICDLEMRCGLGGPFSQLCLTGFIASERSYLLKRLLFLVFLVLSSLKVDDAFQKACFMPLCVQRLLKLPLKFACWRAPLGGEGTLAEDLQRWI